MTHTKLARRRVAIAVALSIVGHACVIAVLAIGLDREADVFAEQPVVEVSFVRLEQPPPKQAREDPPKTGGSPLPSDLAVRQEAPQPAPYALPSPIVAAPGPAPPAAPAEKPSEFRAGCIGKRGGKEESVDCKLEVWSFFDGKPAREISGDDIPADKKVAYAAAARRQAHQRSKPAQLGNGASMGCPQANMGAGCLDDMLVPLTGSRARK